MGKSVVFPTKEKKMKKNYQILYECLLFAGITEADLITLLDCVTSRQKRYKKNDFIFFAGDKTDCLGIVLAGAVHIIREDFWGKRKIVARVEPGGLFGETLVCAGIENLPVSVTAAEETEIMFINSKRITGSCSSACTFHTQLINNLTLLLAKKNLTLIQKLEHITQPNTREKLLSYLSEQARLAGKSRFVIPFNREELADYLSVERSAMSAEMSKMREEGLLLYQKNNFELLKD